MSCEKIDGVSQVSLLCPRGVKKKKPIDRSTGTDDGAGAAVAAYLLFIRSCWRLAELSHGLNGPLTSKEGIFIALDSIPILCLCTLLSLMHPALR